MICKPNPSKLGSPQTAKTAKPSLLLLALPQLEKNYSVVLSEMDLHLQQ